MVRATSRLLVVAVLVVMVAAVSTVATAAANNSTSGIPNGTERRFYSDDPEQSLSDDRANTSTNTSNIDGDPIPVAEYVTVADVGFESVAPDPSETAGQTFQEYRRQQLLELDRTTKTSLHFPHSDLETPWNGGPIQQAHMTFMGIDGGATPHLQTGALAGDYPHYVAESGRVMYYTDYRLVPQVDHPSGRCYHEDSDKMRCVEYTYRYNETRTLTDTGSGKVVDTRYFEGESLSGGGVFSSPPGGGTLSYSNISTNGTTRLQLTNDILLKRTTTRTEYYYDNDDHYWEEYDVHRHNDTWGQTVTDSRKVTVIDDGSLDVEQTIIEIGQDERAAILTLDGPDSETRVTRDDLRNRLLLSSIRFGDAHRIDTTWGVYTKRRYTEAERTNESDVQIPVANPTNVLEANVYVDRRRPIIRSAEDATTDPEVIGYRALNASMTTASFGPNLNFTQRRPLIYERLIVADVQSPVTELETLGGNSVAVDVDERIPYVEPNVTIRKVGPDTVRIRVTNPDTGAPLSGTDVSLFGVDTDSAVTNASGVVEANLSGSFVRAKVPRDSWRNPGDIFYGRASASATYIPTTDLLYRFTDFAFALVLLAPVLLLYLWIESLELEV